MVRSLNRLAFILISVNALEMETFGNAKRARLDATKGLTTDVRSFYGHLQHGIASTSKSIQTIAERVNSEVS
jgi:hypothetical protein